MVAMKKQKTSNKDRISDLPEHLTHQILNYLPINDAAATAILSSSWKNLWLTLPCLRLTEGFYSIRQNNPTISHEQILNSVNNIYTRMSKCGVNYNNITLEELKLHIPILDLNPNTYYVSESLTTQVNNLLVRAVNDFRVKKLNFSIGQLDDYNSELNFTGTYLPISSLGSWKQDNITELKLRGCMLNSCVETRWSTVRCLCLRFVTINQRVLDSITSNCSVLESLKLEFIWGEHGIEMDVLHASCLKRLVTLCIVVGQKNLFKRIELDNPNLEHFEFDEQSGDDGSCVIHDLASSKGLIELNIVNAIITDEQLRMIISYSHFSKLRKLFLSRCDGLRNVQVSNSFLESIELIFIHSLCPVEEMETIDVPALQYLCTSPYIPRFKLHLKWYHRNEHNDSFEYENLIKFLGNFNVAGDTVNHLELQFTEILPSEVISYYVVPADIRQTISCSPLHSVKDLKINYVAYSWKEDDKFDGLIDGLLWLACPKTIIIKLFQQRDHVMVDSKELKEDVCSITGRIVILANELFQTDVGDIAYEK
ncbi:FBD-associated F-box protein At5g27750-like [Beta vulgaris subsp. vulgaris]|uniref:FBD-associated F-box protein At5g27750-like n=1 Tax=Beta vulgaris subsp. vulgaris TaxID=3555 RepID=UPI00053F5120|nr:FBD-associated F-box protein At5g27750-like [Beta vulgaris subsp. vulgaris]